MIFNCHTHVGDAFIKLPSKKFTLEEMVAPPHGYKHRILSKADKREIMEGMKRALRIMEKCHTDVFVDFREGGTEGVELLKKSIGGRKIKAIILSRPSEMKYNEEEMEKLLSISDGIGISAISDWDYEILEAISNHVRERKKIFAMHASEGKREDINAILNLRPHFVVHMCKATEEDIEEVAFKNIGVVICPRANAFFDLTPPLKILMEKGVRTMLGTDNAMIVEPDIMKEMEYVIKKFDVKREEALKMISSTPSKFFGEILKNRVHS